MAHPILLRKHPLRAAEPRREHDNEHDHEHEHDREHGHEPGRAAAAIVPLAALVASIAVAYHTGARFAVLAGAAAGAAAAVGLARTLGGRIALALLCCPLAAAALFAHRQEAHRMDGFERAIAAEHQADRLSAAGSTAAALEAYTKAVALSPSFLGWHKLALARLAAGDGAGAWEAFAQALAAADAPDDAAKELYVRGTHWLAEGQVDLGLAALGEAAHAAAAPDGLR